MAVKPGWKTSEFWLTLAATLLPMVNQGVPGLNLPVDDSMAFLVSGVAIAGYAVSRGLVK